MTATEALQSVPKTTPAWAIKLVAALIAGAGAALPWWNPLHLTGSTAKAIIVLGFLVVAGVIFTVQVVLAAVHKDGFTRAALGRVETAEETEMRTLWPEIRTSYAAAAPALTAIPGLAGTVGTLTDDVADVKRRLGPEDAVALTAVLNHAITPPLTSAAQLGAAAPAVVAATDDVATRESAALEPIVVEPAVVEPTAGPVTIEAATDDDGTITSP